MDQRNTPKPAQSSIRSFFQPLLQQAQPKQNYPQTPQHPHALPFAKSASLSPQLTLPSPPPPVKLPSSYALPPNSQQERKQSSEPHSFQHSTKSTSKLPQGAAIIPITLDHINSIRRINALLLPIPYSDTFYKSILPTSHPSIPQLSKTILWEGKVIGGIICRFERSPSSLAVLNPKPLPKDTALDEDGQTQGEKGPWDVYLYIQSLCLLSPYRGKGLVAAALDEIFADAVHLARGGVRIRGAYAHVWTRNEEALEWYTKRGFKADKEELKGYYRQLKPDTAFIFRRELNIGDFLPSIESNGHPEESSRFSQQSTKPPPIPSSQLPPPPKSSSPNPSLTSSANNLLRPSGPPQSRSYQTRGPEREWNDLPEEVLSLPNSSTNSLKLPGESGVSSSRSSSRSGLGDGTATIGRGKKKRVYPAAAFGS